ncbi:MAG TPA: cobalamin-binding protein [Limnochordales bacterium]
MPVTPSRIVSLLPSATEILYALGLGDRVCGVTHECDYPPDARTKRVLVQPAFDPIRMTPAEIDAVVARLAREGKSTYVVDEAGLQELQPDMIVTQSLCEVCAVAGNHLAGVLPRLARRPEVVTLHPHTLGDILDDIRTVGAAAGMPEAAEALVAELRRRIDAVRTLAASTAERPRVACIEWYEPPYTGGHWVPEMVELAGGTPVLSQVGQPSRRVRWDEVVEAAPEVLVLMPCGYDTRRAVAEAGALAGLPGWRDLPAVRSGRVYAVNAHAYFNRPGPRLVYGLEILAFILHPDRFPKPAASDCTRVVETAGSTGPDAAEVGV